MIRAFATFEITATAQGIFALVCLERITSCSPAAKSERSGAFGGQVALLVIRPVIYSCDPFLEFGFVL